jgi:hypothetical protein
LPLNIVFQHSRPISAFIYDWNIKPYLRSAYSEEDHECIST